MYHLIGVVYRIRRYTGVYRPLCMLLLPDLSLPGEPLQIKTHSTGSEQRALMVGSNGHIATKETVYIIYTSIIFYLFFHLWPTNISDDINI